MFGLDEAGNIVDPVQVARYGRVEASGPFFSDASIPSSLLDIVAFAFREHAPILLSTCDLVANFLQENPKENVLPRGIGFHEFKIGSVVENRMAFSYDAWMALRMMEQGKSAACKSLLSKMPNGEKFLKYDWSKCQVDFIPGAKVVRAPKDRDAKL